MQQAAPFFVVFFLATFFSVVFLLVVVDQSEAEVDPLAVLQQRNTNTVAVAAHKEA